MKVAILALCFLSLNTFARVVHRTEYIDEPVVIGPSSCFIEIPLLVIHEGEVTIPATGWKSAETRYFNYVTNDVSVQSIAVSSIKDFFEETGSFADKNRNEVKKVTTIINRYGRGKYLTSTLSYQQLKQLIAKCDNKK